MAGSRSIKPRNSSYIYKLRADQIHPTYLQKKTAHILRKIQVLICMLFYCLISAKRLASYVNFTKNLHFLEKACKFLVKLFDKLYQVAIFLKENSLKKVKEQIYRKQVWFTALYNFIRQFYCSKSFLNPGLIVLSYRSIVWPTDKLLPLEPVD